MLPRACVALPAAGHIASPRTVAPAAAAAVLLLPPSWANGGRSSPAAHTCARELRRRTALPFAAFHAFHRLSTADRRGAAADAGLEALLRSPRHTDLYGRAKVPERVVL